MAEFELVFKGRLNLYLRSLGLDVTKIESYEACVDGDTLRVFYSDSGRRTRCWSYNGPLGSLFQQM